MTNERRDSVHLFMAPLLWLLIILIVLVNVFTFVFGSFFDTAHYSDTFFIFGAAWRILEGLRPVLDFGHFYGGFIAETLSWTMSIFSVDVSVFYLHTLILSGILICFAHLFSRNHISVIGFLAVVLMILTIMSTRYPLEFNEPIIRVVSTHSFYYNRFAQAAMFTVSLFVFFKSDFAGREFTCGLFAGLLVGAVCLTKSTFVVVFPGLIFALLFACRWVAIAGAFTGVCLFFLLFDPELSRFLGSLEYALAHVGKENSVTSLIRKSLQIPIYQPVAALATLAIVVCCLKEKASRAPIIAGIIFTGSLVGMTATMGGNGSGGQLALPTLIGLCIGCTALEKKHLGKNQYIVSIASLILSLGFVVPHTANIVGAAAEGYTRAPERLIQDGPYRRYLSVPEQPMGQAGPTQYELLADGMHALRRIGNPSHWGVVADAGITFEHALLAKPVAGYPLWQRETAPELASDRELSTEIDIILLARTSENVIGKVLRSKLTDAFSLCSVSDHWEIYAHQRLELNRCTNG